MTSSPHSQPLSSPLPPHPHGHAARELLRNRGLRVTRPRMAIIGVLMKRRRPMSVQQIIEALSSSVDQATVYRTVRSLNERGIIRPIDLRHQHTHYEITDADAHHHLVCVQCGRIEDVRHCKLDRWEHEIIKNAKHFAEIRQHALEFYGICKSCARAGIQAQSAR